MAAVVLVQPKVGTWDELRSHPSVPLALLSAARCVASEFDTALIDTRVDRKWRESLKKELEGGALCVGVTSMTGRQIGHALEISRYVKEISDVPVVWGGIHASLMPDSTLENPCVDILVVGEGELTFLELVRALEARTSLRGIPGVWYKESGEIIRNPTRAFASLDDLPPLPLSLVDIESFLPVFKGRRTFYVETSRGCPCRCTFCFNTAYNQGTWRAFGAERVLGDLEYLQTHFDVGSFYLVDDNFFVDLKRARAIAQGMIDRKLGLIWEVQGITITSAAKMDDEYVSLLVEAGMKKVHFGIESGSARVLKALNKSLKIEDAVMVNRDWSRHDVVVQYNFMCGFPGETIEDIRMSKDLAFRLMDENERALISPFCPFTPYPGTTIYRESLDGGFITRRKLEDWVETDYGDALWTSKPRRKLLGSLFFASMFLDEHRSKDMVQSRILKLLIGLYRPIARFRVKHLFFRLMPEVWISRLFFR